MLTRKMLKAMSIEEDKIEQIIEAHIETVNPLKDKAKNVEELTKQIEEITKQRDELANKNDDVASSQRISELENKLLEYENKEKTALTHKEFKEKLSQAGIDEKKHNAIIKITDFNSLDLKAENIVDNLKAEYPEFIIQSSTETHAPTTPPSTAPNIEDPFLMGLKK